MPTVITIEALIAALPKKVWELYTQPTHITQWNAASADWHTTRAEVDLRAGGKFLSRMEAKDGSFGFDFIGAYDDVKRYEHIAYTMEDGRKARISMEATSNQTKMVIEFEAETANSVDMQRQGWQAILDNFKKYVEAT